MFGPPVFFVVALVAVFMDKYCDWARNGLLVSFITFVLWLIFVIGGGFEKYES
jgi:hypothetical protein